MYIYVYGMEFEGCWFTCAMRSVKGQSQAVLKGMEFDCSYEDNEQYIRGEDFEKMDEKNMMEFFKEHDEGDKQTMDLIEGDGEVNDGTDGRREGGGGVWRSVAPTAGHIQDREVKKRKKCMDEAKDIKMRFEWGQAERAGEREDEDVLHRNRRGTVL